MQRGHSAPSWRRQTSRQTTILTDPIDIGAPVCPAATGPLRQARARAANGGSGDHRPAYRPPDGARAALQVRREPGELPVSLAPALEGSRSGRQIWSAQRWVEFEISELNFVMQM